MNTPLEPGTEEFYAKLEEFKKHMERDSRDLRNRQRGERRMQFALWLVAVGCTLNAIAAIGRILSHQ